VEEIDELEIASVRKEASVAAAASPEHIASDQLPNRCIFRQIIWDRKDL
jgi:hypothetical protein